MNLDTLSVNDLYKEIAEIARNQGVTSQAGWDDLVSEVVESHLNLGELDPDQPTEGYKEQLSSRWETYQQTAGEESKDAISEDPEHPHA